MKLVHWPLMGGLLHLAQRGGDWKEPQPVQAPPRLHHVGCVCIGNVYFDTQTFSRVALPTHKLCLCSRRSGLAALSLSSTVLGRRVSVRVWSRTQITLALRGCMVLVSVKLY